MPGLTDTIRNLLGGGSGDSVSNQQAIEELMRRREFLASLGGQEVPVQQQTEAGNPGAPGTMAPAPPANPAPTPQDTVFERIKQILTQGR